MELDGWSDPVKHHVQIVEAYDCRVRTVATWQHSTIVSSAADELAPGWLRKAQSCSRKDGMALQVVAQHP